MGLGVTTLLLLSGCLGKSEDVAPKEVSPLEKTYNQVLDKTVKDCKAQGVVLDEKRVDVFLHKFSEDEINKAAQIDKEIPKKNCLFIADEVSDEKQEKVKEFVQRAKGRCEEFGIELSSQKLTAQAQKIPLFIIKKILEKPNESTQEECLQMEKKYK